MRRFHLYRERDHTGISGVGLVAEGVEASNGQVAMWWLGNLSSLTIHSSIANVEAIHGHRGSTHVVWLDEKQPEPSDRLKTALREAVGEHQRASRRITSLIKMITGDHPRYYRGRARTSKQRKEPDGKVNTGRSDALSGQSQEQDQEVHPQPSSRPEATQEE